jgi:hypothetical protein
MRAGVHARSARAEAAGPDADRRACDRQLDDAERRRWSTMRRELAAVAAGPERVAGAAVAARLAGHPAQLDEPDDQSLESPTAAPHYLVRAARTALERW